MPWPCPWTSSSRAVPRKARASAHRRPCPAPAARRAASGLAHGLEGRPELPQTRTPLRPRSPLPTPPRPGRSPHSCPATIGEPPEPPQTPGGRARSSEEQAGAGQAELEGEDRPLRTRSAVSTGRSCRARPDSTTRGFWSGDERAVPRASCPPWGSALGWGVGPAQGPTGLPVAVGEERRGLFPDAGRGARGAHTAG